MVKKTHYYKEKNINDNKTLDSLDYESSVVSKTLKVFYAIKYIIYYKILRKKKSF